MVSEQIESTLFAADTRSCASHSALQENNEAMKMKDISGQKCLELYEASGRDGSLPKMLLGTLGLVSTKLPHHWKLKASPSGRLLFQLVPLAHHTEGTGCGLWATPNTMDHLPPRSPESLERQMTTTRKGRTKLANLRDQLVYGMNWMPTPATSDAKGASAKRFLGSKHYRSNFREALRNGPTDGIYPNPEFVEWVMGYSIGHTELEQEVTRSSRKSHT